MKQSMIAMAVLSALASGSAAQAAELDSQILWSLNVDRLEYGLRDGKDMIAWDANLWIGNDEHKAELVTEGEKDQPGDVEQAEVQLRYRRPVSEFFDMVAGLRYDIEPEPDRGYVLLGVTGLAPQWVEVEALAFASEKGDMSARIEAEYDLLLTQKLVLQPAAEVNLALQDVEELGIGAGISDVELGLRLRYEVRREFAPYIGYQWERKLGQTADFAKADGEEIQSHALVAGVKFWL